MQGVVGPNVHRTEKTPARLNPGLVGKIISSFPRAPNWHRFSCESLLRLESNQPGRTWSSLKSCAGQGGLYAFLFSGQFFKSPRQIILDGPGRRPIDFEFGGDALPTLADGNLVLYAGRTSNVLKRLQLHFSLATRNTGAQVQYGLVKCGVARDRATAVGLMLSHAKVVYTLLPGDENVANRDIVEVGLWSKYMTPFNIKSER